MIEIDNTLSNRMIWAAEAVMTFLVVAVCMDAAGVPRIIAAAPDLVLACVLMFTVTIRLDVWVRKRWRRARGSGG